MRSLGERLNPVAVKDVRQSLRGRLFRVVFAINLSLATVVVLFALISVANSSRDDSGLVVFTTGHSVYALCAMVLVPLLANRSMASERDDHSLDALLISGLDTTSIVRGKSQSALVMLGMFLSSTAPFLALGYTLHGLDVVTSLAIILSTTVIGATMCMAGIVIATLTSNRTLDTLALGLQLLASTLLCWAWLMAAYGWLGFAARGVGAGEFVLGLSIWIIALLGVRAWLFAAGVSALSHPEENTSTRLRLTSLAMTLLCVVGCFVAWGMNGPSRAIIALGALIMVLLTLGMVNVCTEPEQLSRRMRLDIAEKRGHWQRPLQWLLLPGGGRGFTLYLGTLMVVLLLGALAAEALPNSHEAFAGLWTTAVVCMPHVGLVSWLNSLKPRKPGGPLLRLRVLIVLLPFGLALASVVVGLLLEDGPMRAGRSWLNPFWVVIESFDDGLNGAAGPATMFWTLLAAAVLLLNLPRLVSGHREAVQALGDGASVDAPRT